MPLSVVKVTSGGLPVSAATTVLGGMPVLIAANGYGVAVTTVASGGMPVTDVGGTLFGPAVAPVNTVLPVISGSTVIGQTLTTTNGTWTGSPTPTFTYQWKRNDPITPASWDVATASSVTLSGGDLVATNTGTTSASQGAHVIASSGKTTGKYYFETTWTAFTGGINLGVGVGTTASTYTNMGSGGTTGIIAYRTGTIWSNGSSVLSWTAWGTGTVMVVAIDLDNRKFWVRGAAGGNWNNSGTANPATNTGGLTIPAGTMVPFVTFGGSAGLANNVVTANFGASAFVGAVPSGFTAGWTA